MFRSRRQRLIWEVSNTNRPITQAHLDAMRDKPTPTTRTTWSGMWNDILQPAMIRIGFVLFGLLACAAIIYGTTRP